MLIISVNVNAQQLYKGFIYDSATKAIMPTVRIENLTTHEGTYSNNIGYFELDAKEGDYIEFSFVSYKNKVVRIAAVDQRSYASIY
jgi:hypothetical protein